MLIATSKFYLETDKVEMYENTSTGSLRICFVSGNCIYLSKEEAQQIREYLDGIACPVYGLEVPEITKEYQK